MIRDKRIVVVRVFIKKTQKTPRREIDLARVLIEARIGAKLTQAQLAERMQTTQSVIARLESGRVHPSTKTLQKIAQATGTRLKISFETTSAPN